MNKMARKTLLLLSLVFTSMLFFTACSSKKIDVKEVLTSGDWHSAFDDSIVRFDSIVSGELDLNTGVELSFFEYKRFDWKELENNQFEITFHGTFGPYVFQIERIKQDKKELYVINELENPDCVFLLSPSSDDWVILKNHIGTISSIDADSEGATFGGAVSYFRAECEEELAYEKKREESEAELEKIQDALDLIEEGKKLFGLD